MVFTSEMDDCDMVREAHELGFRQLTFDHFKKHNKVVQLIPLDVDATPGLRMLGQHLGENYDYFGLFGMGFVEIGRWLKRKFRWWHHRISNPWRSATNMFCSESVVKFLQECKSKMGEDLVPDTISPQELRDALNGKV